MLIKTNGSTDEKQSDGALKESEMRYRRLFETAQDGILILDAETGEVTNVNPFLMKMLGYSKNNFLSIQDLLMLPRLSEFRLQFQLIFLLLILFSCFLFHLHLKQVLNINNYI